MAAPSPSPAKRPGLLNFQSRSNAVFAGIPARPNRLTRRRAVAGLRHSHFSITWQSFSPHGTIQRFRPKHAKYAEQRPAEQILFINWPVEGECASRNAPPIATALIQRSSPLFAYFAYFAVHRLHCSLPGSILALSETTGKGTEGRVRSRL